MRYNTVIFDMDGTLLNTLDDIADSTNAVLERHGYSTWPIEDIRHFVGNGADVLMDCVLPDGKDDPNFEELLVEYKAYYQEHCNIKTGPYPHMMDMLKELKQRGYKMAIVSNKPMGAVKELTKAYFGDYFDVAIGVTDDLRRKPYPDECIKAMEDLCSTKDESIYVGDSEIDHQTAVNTDLKCISCLWGFRTREELIEAGAGENIFVEDPLDIVKVLEDLNR
jgi:phosphoglycolate phosphatase